MTNVGWIGGADLHSIRAIKGEICGAPDVSRLFEWAEINGIRRVTKITMQSASINTKYDLPPTFAIERVFSYQSVYPFDLVSAIDSVVV